MTKKNIYFFIGTTAELIKTAPVMRELEKRGQKYKLISSGQNKIRFEDLNGFIKKKYPDIILPEKKNKSSTYHFLFWAFRTVFQSMISLRKEFNDIDKKNAYMIIHGDTVTSSIGAIIGKFFGLKIVLIECGDLSFNLLEPFPEEICRNINLRLADTLFPPNQWAANNLKAAHGVIINTKQNTLIESFLWAKKEKIINKNITKINKYYLLIMHRQEHVIFRKDWSKKILEFVIKNSNKNLTCILINHPLTISIINGLNLTSKNVNKIKMKIISQVPYTDFMKLMKKAEYIASDSAFNQLEAYLMGKPFLALRDRTEQIEGLNKNVVICKSNNKILKKFLSNYKNYQTNPVTTNVKPSKIIVDYLLKK